MMQSTVELGNNERLDMGPAREALRLWPAVGGARLDLQLSVARAIEAVPAVAYRSAVCCP